jgi:co-chaperonin GroES (HSP10)
MKRLFYLTILSIFLPSIAHGATAIYRSVGPSATSSLVDGGASHTMTISSSTATFSAPLPDHVGVGDAIQYDDDGDDDIDANDSIIFIHGRTSSTTYTVATASGGTPVAVTDEEQWNIFRAYTSLANAETGTENTGIDADLVNFDTFTTGKDITDTTGSDEEWNIACYANGTTADTTAVTIDGWTTDSDNFLRLYTPFEKDDVGESQRHAGVWESNKYILDVASGYAIENNDNYVRIEGIQIDHGDSTATAIFNGTIPSGGTEIQVSSNLIKGNNGSYAAGIVFNDSDITTTKVWNNIIYDFDGGFGKGVHYSGSSGTGYVYNNTTHGCHFGYNRTDSGGTIVLKNNVAQSSTNDVNDEGTTGYSSASTNNIVESSAQDGAFGTQADSGTTTGTPSANKLVATGQNFLTTVRKGMIVQDSASNYSYVTAVDSDNQLSVNDDIFGASEAYTIYTNMYGAVTFADEGNDDFHLGTADTLAQNNGTDLSSDGTLPFSDDIDDHTRALQWDIGADQLEPTEFESIIDPDNGTGTDYTSLNSWESNVQADLTTNATRVYAGAVTTGSIADTDTVTLYRGGSSMGITANVTHATSDQLLLDTISNTSAGFEVNDQWRVDGSNYFTITNTGDSAIALATCRSTSGTADTSRLTIEGWTTSASNYIKVWTDPSENHRHPGKWDDRKFRMTSTDSDTVQIYEEYVTVEGLQMFLSVSSGWSDAIYVDVADGADVNVNNNIIKANFTSTGYGYGIRPSFAGAGSRELSIFNNVIYDFSNAGNGAGIFHNGDGFITYCYNNTIFNSYQGFYQNTGTIIAKNNIAQNCTDGFTPGFDASSDYNISDLASDAPGSNSKNSTTVTFVDEDNKDFHLDSSDTAALNAGVDLSSDPSLDFTDDVDGTSRGGAWDIGADEVPVEFVTLVMESGGDESTLSAWENAVEADLTADTTRVFTGTLTGSLSENDTLELYRGGVDQGIDLTHVYEVSAGSTDQLLADGITESNLVVQSGDVLRKDASNYFTVSGSGDDLGASPIATAKIDGTWASADGAVTITNWTTDQDNYIRIYTTEIARHDGKWDDTAHRMVADAWKVLSVNEAYTKVEGIQAETTRSSGNTVAFSVDSDMAEISSCIAKTAITTASYYQVGFNASAGAGTFSYFKNNIAYDFAGTHASTFAFYAGTGTSYFHNNTAHNSRGGFGKYGSVATVGILMNNIAQDCTDDFYTSGIFDASSAYNITDVVPSANSAFGATHTTGTANSDSSGHLVNSGDTFQTDGVQVGSIVKNTTDTTYGYVTAINSETDLTLDSDVFPDGDENYEIYTNKYGSVTFEDETNDDFHLSSSDTLAQNKGADLSSDSNLPIADDIDGAERDPDGLGFDIGADEVPVAIYRSVGPSSTSALDDDDSHGDTVAVSSGTATFTGTTIPDNVGIGDVVIIDTGGTDQTIESADTLLFISGRTDSTHYTLQTESGAVPADISSNDTWQIYRAYTNLSNAEAGTENTTVSGLGFSYTGGDRDLVTNNEQWNIACYGDATDTTALDIEDWTTGEQNYLKIYAPAESTEVGKTQRHQGKWDSNKYNIITGSWSAIDVISNYVRLQGLQIKRTSNGGGALGISKHDIYLDKLILWTETADTGRAISFSDGVDAKYSYLTNSLIYGAWDIGVYINYGYGYRYFYNNTFKDVNTGFSNYGGYVLKMKNCIFDDVTADFSTNSSVNKYSQNNSTSLDSGTSGLNVGTYSDNLFSQNISFVNETENNLHLSPNETNMIDAGADLSADADFAFSDDIDGHLRTEWDIGADEASIEFDPTVMESGGDYSTLALWETGMQTDLTADTTRVFSHGGITGSIADTDTVTGATSAATADVVHASSSEILLENISGTFQIGEQVQVDGSNHVTISNAGNPAIAVAKIDGAWANAESSSIDINGWSTGPSNYVRIYTTEAARHDGKWNDSKYRIESGNQWVLMTSVAHTRFEGLQVESLWGAAFTPAGAIYQGYTAGGGTIIEENIVRYGNSGDYGSGISVATNTGNPAPIVRNNIIYGFDGVNAVCMYGEGDTAYFVNNTIYGCATGFRGHWAQGQVSMNNIVQGSSVANFDSSFATNSTHNITGEDAEDGAWGTTWSTGTTDGTTATKLVDSGATFQTDGVQVGSIIENTTDSTYTYVTAIDSETTLSVNDDYFVSGEGYEVFTNIFGNATFVDEANNDFHLDQNDTVAKDKGTDLSSDTNLNFTTDIDGSTRGTDWDIGADEASVEFEATVMASGGDYASLSAWESGVETDLTSAATLVFSHGGVTGTIADDASVTGATSSATATVVHATTTQILLESISGTFQSGEQVQVDGSNHVTISDNGNPAIAVAKIDGTWSSAEANFIDIDGWTTGHDNYIHIYTTETARHDGKWSDSAYRLSRTNADLMDIGEEFVRIDGLQFYHEVTSEYWPGTLSLEFDNLDSDIRISNNIFWASWTYTSATTSGTIIGHGFSDDSNKRIWNNLFIDATTPNAQNSSSLYLSTGHSFVYNNTFHNCDRGMTNSGGTGTLYIKNNVFKDCDDPISSTLISSDSGSNVLDASIGDGIFGTTWSTGTTTSTSAGKLVDSSATFVTDGVQVGSIIMNTVDYNYTYVTAIDSETQLSINDDNFTSGETYNVYTNKYGSVTFEDEANDDLHLSVDDTLAQNSGADLSSDASLQMSDDIDGAERDSDGEGWDIGADELPAAIYRSVGPSNTSALDDDDSHGDTVALSSGTATFTGTTIPDNVGVGDVVIIDTGGTDQTIDSADTLLFISGRTDSTHYTLQTESGAVPADIASNDTWQIYRAYTSLSNAESGTENDTITTTLGFSGFTGGDRDLVTNNEQWNIACYDDADVVDTTGGLDVDGWTTKQQNYLRIYTPFDTSEVGTSQRHNGKWTTNAFNITNNRTDGNQAALQALDEYVIFEGMQVAVSGTGTYRYGISANVNNVTIKENIVKNLGTSGSPNGIETSNLDGTKIVNNIVYGFSDTDSYGIIAYGTEGEQFIYNNTVYDTYNGIYTSYQDAVTKNNLVQICSNYCFSPDFNPASDYNISSDTSAPGGNSHTETTVDFISTVAGNEDFHLDPDEATAIDAGDDLSADSNFAFSDDIDGHLRTDWDIGADEASIEFDPTVMESGGDYSTLALWETGVQTDLTADTTRVFSHGGISGTLVDGDNCAGANSAATATIVHASDDQILLENIVGTFESGELVQSSAFDYVVISDAGNPAHAVAKIDGTWTSAEGSTILVDGWETSPNNYIKIYTTTAGRHNGAWDDTKYRLEVDNECLILNEKNVWVDGLQVNVHPTAGGDTYDEGIIVEMTLDVDDIWISNNIVKQSNVTNNSAGIVTMQYLDDAHKTRIWNNIVYGFNGTDETGIFGYGWGERLLYVYNNTVLDSTRCFYGGDGNIAKNNIAQDCSTDFAGSYNASSSNNISSDSTAPGTNSQTSTTVTFRDAANDDYRLDSEDPAAIDQGTDLSADANLNFTTDIEGDTRLTGSWDIGADEAQSRIFRSVGPSQTAALDDDNSGADLLTIANSVASFSSDLELNVGVGDALVYDDDGDDDIDSNDSIVFIHKRNDADEFVVKDDDGTWPTTTVTDEDDWEIYRAHTSLADAEAGTANSTLSTYGFSFNGGNRDISANNEQWNIACYANGTTADSTIADIDGWTTGEQNYLKVFVPASTSEVGTIQRHVGAWDNTKYYLETDSADGISLSIDDSHSVIDGLQVDITGIYSGVGAIDGGSTGMTNVTVSNNIVRNSSTGSGGGGSYLRGISGFTDNNGDIKIYNNIVYDFLHGGIWVVNSSTGSSYIYNNTVMNCGDYGIQDGYNDTIAINNIVQGNTDGYYGAFNSSSDYNISDLVSDNTGGTNDQDDTNVEFFDADNDDFHLSPFDEAALGQGTNLSSDSNLPFSTDIDGEERPSEGWDVGADEMSHTKYKFKGETKFKGNIRIK